MSPVTAKAPAWKFTPDPAWTRGLAEAPLGPMHGGLALDRDGFLYCSTDGPRSVIVFAPDGSVVREFASEFAGIHALTVVEVAGLEFLLATHLTAHRIVMLTLDGALVWALGAPMESGYYRSPEAFKPTAAVIAPDGSLFVADGYGSSVIHQFDPRRRYVKSFGGTEAGAGELRNCHGMALDTHSADPRLLICDRRNRRLVHFDLEGRFVGVLADNLRRPCSVAFHGDHFAVAELEGRVSVFDGNHRLVARVGDNPDASQWAQYEAPSSTWRSEVFIAPHAVCFDRDGNLFVSEWSSTGRLTKLQSTHHEPASN